MKKYRRVNSHNTEVCAKFEEKLTVGSKNDMRHLVNFNVNSGKSEDLYFDVPIFSIANKVPAKKVLKNFFSWHWKKFQTLEKNWLFVWNTTWEIWWTLIQAVELLKMCSLIKFFRRKYVMFVLKYREVVSWKMTYSFKNDMSNLVNFHSSSWK